MNTAGAEQSSAPISLRDRDDCHVMANLWKDSCKSMNVAARRSAAQPTCSPDRVQLIQVKLSGTCAFTEREIARAAAKSVEEPWMHRRSRMRASFRVNPKRSRKPCEAQQILKGGLLVQMTETSLDVLPFERSSTICIFKGNREGREE